MFYYNDVPTLPNKWQDEVDNLHQATPSKIEKHIFSEMMGQATSTLSPRILNGAFLSTPLINQAPHFESNGQFKFSIYFPDGAKARVVASNQPRKLELEIKTNSRHLARKLRSVKKHSEQELATFWGKPVSINVDEHD